MRVINTLVQKTDERVKLSFLDNLFARESVESDMPFNLQNMVFILKTSNIDLQSMFIEMNDLMCNLLEYSRDELLDMTLCDLIDTDCFAFLEKKQKELLHNDFIKYNIAFIRKFGGKIKLEVESCIFKSEDYIVEFAVAKIK